jgi:hypothetical protein
MELRSCVIGFVCRIHELKKKILEEGHKSRFSIHPRATKKYHNLQKLF